MPTAPGTAPPENRRREPRVPDVLCAIRLGSPGREKSDVATLIDLSPGGVGVEVDGPLSPNTPLLVELLLPMDDVSRTLHGKVAWCAASAGSTRHRVGVEFVDLPEADAAAIRNALDEHARRSSADDRAGLPPVKEIRDGILILRPRGPIGGRAVAVLRNLLCSTREGKWPVVLNLAGATDLDPASWGVILAAGKELLDADRPLVNVVSSPAIQEQLQSLALDHVLDFAPNEEEAVRGFGFARSSAQGSGGS